MMRRFASLCLSNKQQLAAAAASLCNSNKQPLAAASLFCTSATPPLKYTIREAVVGDYMRVTQLRAKELWNISNLEEIQDWCQALFNARSPEFHVIVAAKETDQNVAAEIYGAVDLLVSKNAMKDVHDGQVPDEWKSEDGKLQDAYLTDLAVASFARRQHIAMNLLNYAKDLAASKNMSKLFAEVHKDNHAVIALNRKLGFEGITYNVRSEHFLMGLKLSS